MNGEPASLRSLLLDPLGGGVGSRLDAAGRELEESGRAAPTSVLAV